MTAVEEVKKKDIVDSLYWDIRVDASDVGVQVEDNVTVAVDRGKVTLTGDVLTWSARNQARDIAASVPGVIVIENLVTVT